MINTFKKYFLLLIFFHTSLYISAQDYEQILYQEFKMPLYGLKLDTSSFQISGVIDNRKHILQIGEIYYQDRGKVILQVTDELPAVFNPYFDRAMKLAKIGKKKDQKPVWWQSSSFRIWGRGFGSKYLRISKCCWFTHTSRIWFNRSFSSRKL